MRPSVEARAGAGPAAIRNFGFAAGAGLMLVAYVIFMLNHPGTGHRSAYPDPVGIYAVAMPAYLPATAESLRVGIESTAAPCPGTTPYFVRTVGPGRCRNLLARWPGAVSGSGLDGECRYFYSSLDAARQGRDVVHVASGGRCLTARKDVAGLEPDLSR